MLTQTAQHLTIVELFSKVINVSDSIDCGYPIRDREVVELYSDSPLDYPTIKAKATRPGWVITSIQEVNLATAPAEF